MQVAQVASAKGRLVPKRRAIVSTVLALAAISVAMLSYTTAFAGAGDNYYCEVAIASGAHCNAENSHNYWYNAAYYNGSGTVPVREWVSVFDYICSNREGNNYVNSEADHVAGRGMYPNCGSHAPGYQPGAAAYNESAWTHTIIGHVQW